MKNRLILAFLSLVFASVANAQPECRAGRCSLSVTVNTAGDGSCSASVDKPVLIVAEHNAPVLVWNIATPNYVFTSEGIVFYDPPNPPDFEHKQVKPTEVQIVDAHNQSGDFHYRVEVQGCTQLDPIIHNN